MCPDCFVTHVPGYSRTISGFLAFFQFRTRWLLVMAF
jgi:hypothetical protein